jgi:cobalt-zinc-cadmium resistance protein CzcA
MIGALVAWSVRNRLLVFLAVLALVFAGVRGYRALPVDAVPDITNVQVQVLSSAPGLSPLEVEQLVTRPVELAMTGLPGLALVRSVSRSGISAVTLVFDDDVRLEDARSLVSQRLPSAREAARVANASPAMGPLTTGLGEVFHFTLVWPGHTSSEVRALLDWEVAYGLRSVPGVVEVNAWGGDVRQVEVRLRTTDMIALGVTQEQIENALLRGGENAGGGAIEREGEQTLVRFDGQYRSVDDVAEQVVATRGAGIPIRVRDVATVRDGTAFRLAAATADGDGETVYAMVQMIAGGNAHEIVARVKERLATIEARLPEGARVEPFYDRAALVDRVLRTVRTNLLEGGVIVTLVLLLFLGEIGPGLVVATTIPLSMLGAFALMRAFDISGNLMSLGAIDFGLLVDGAVVMVEGAMAAMVLRKLDPKDALVHEGRTIGRPIAFGIFIQCIVYVSVLTLEGVEGKMFRPMAATVLFALITSFVLTFTWIPALAATVLRGHARQAREPWVVRHVRRVYEPFAERMVARPTTAVVLALALVLSGGAVAATRGAEFIPRLEEGDIAIQVTRPPSVSLAEAVRGTSELERALRNFPEVERVVSRTGSPDVATDVMGLEQSDVFVMLRPRSTWTTAEDREGLIAHFDEAATRALPGAVFSFTQPIEMRSQELLGGMKSDLGIKVHGDDLETLTALAEEIVRIAGSVPGIEDVRMDPTRGLPMTTVRPDPPRAGRLGVRPDELRRTIEALRAGREVGTLVERERRFDVVVRHDHVDGPEADVIAAFPIVREGGLVVPLGDVAHVRRTEGPAQINREQARRRVQVEANVRGRDLAGAVQDLRSRLASVALPPGYFISLSGQYENLVDAAKRLAVIVPATALVIFVLLYLAFGSARPALLVGLNLPVATSGGLFALLVRGLPMSISAAVGCIALFGIATLNGVVFVSAARRLEAEGLGPRDAAVGAAKERMRPVLTTAVVAALGFFPMAVATGTGAEVQRPLASVVIGGLVTATLLTLGLLPAVYGRFAGAPKAARRRAVGEP